MNFTTFDIEFADFIIPSICSISIIDWDESGIKNVYKKMINPDCDMDPYLENRHKIDINSLKDKPTIQEIWIDVYNHLENKLVFSHNANRNVNSLKQLASINYLNMPPFNFCCTASISRKLWPNFKSSDLKEVTERLGVNDKHYNAFEDSKSVGYILSKALDDTCSESIEQLFKQIGFTGGYVKDNEKHVYRAIKRNNEYIIRTRQNGDIQELDWETFQKNILR